MRDDMSADGIPAALFFISTFFVFVVVTLGYDELIVKCLGVTHTITYGIRYLDYHYPVVMTALLGAFLLLVVVLLLHFLCDMPLLPR